MVVHDQQKKLMKELSSSTNLLCYELCISCVLLISVIEIVIQRSNYTAEGKRIYDKAHQFLLQNAKKIIIGDQLQLVHKREDEILSLKDLDPSLKSIKLDELRYRGDYYHNMVTLKTGGDLVVCRRPKETAAVNVSDYVPCKFCLAFITKAEM